MTEQRVEREKSGRVPPPRLRLSGILSGGCCVSTTAAAAAAAAKALPPSSAHCDRPSLQSDAGSGSLGAAERLTEGKGSPLTPPPHRTDSPA